MGPDHDGATIEGEVVAAVAAHGDGAVVLLHGWPRGTLAAVTGIVDRLRLDGLHIRHVSTSSTRSRRYQLDVSARERATVAVVAVDGGNSKTDVALVGWDGRLLAAVAWSHDLAPGGRDGRRR